MEMKIGCLATKIPQSAIWRMGTRLIPHKQLW